MRSDGADEFKSGRNFSDLLTVEENKTVVLNEQRESFFKFAEAAHFSQVEGLRDADFTTPEGLATAINAIDTIQQAIINEEKNPKILDLYAHAEALKTLCFYHPITVQDKEEGRGFKVIGDGLPMRVGGRPILYLQVEDAEEFQDYLREQADRVFKITRAGFAEAEVSEVRERSAVLTDLQEILRADKAALSQAKASEEKEGDSSREIGLTDAVDNVLSVDVSTKEGIQQIKREARTLQKTLLNSLEEVDPLLRMELYGRAGAIAAVASSNISTGMAAELDQKLANKVAAAPHQQLSEEELKAEQERFKGLASFTSTIPVAQIPAVYYSQAEKFINERMMPKSPQAVSEQRKEHLYEIGVGALRKAQEDFITAVGTQISPQEKQRLIRAHFLFEEMQKLGQYVDTIPEQFRGEQSDIGGIIYAMSLRNLGDAKGLEALSKDADLLKDAAVKCRAKIDDSITVINIIASAEVISKFAVEPIEQKNLTDITVESENGKLVTIANLMAEYEGVSIDNLKEPEENSVIQQTNRVQQAPTQSWFGSLFRRRASSSATITAPENSGVKVTTPQKISGDILQEASRIVDGQHMVLSAGEKSSGGSGGHVDRLAQKGDYFKIQDVAEAIKAVNNQHKRKASIKLMTEITKNNDPESLISQSQVRQTLMRIVGPRAVDETMRQVLENLGAQKEGHTRA